MLRATKIAEESGVPGVAVIASGFMSQAKATARAMGAPDMGIVSYPGNIPLDTSDELAVRALGWDPLRVDLGFGTDDNVVMVQSVVVPALYAESDDPERMVPMLLKPEWTNIVLAGDPERNQARIYINNHEHAPPTAKKVAMPEDWKERLQRR